jgi:hypothetical protein
MTDKKKDTPKPQPQKGTRDSWPGAMDHSIENVRSDSDIRINTVRNSAPPTKKDNNDGK